jgi:hypothetical protein
MSGGGHPNARCQSGLLIMQGVIQDKQLHDDWAMVSGNVEIFFDPRATHQAAPPPSTMGMSLHLEVAPQQKKKYVGPWAPHAMHQLQPLRAKTLQMQVQIHEEDDPVPEEFAYP